MVYTVTSNGQTRTVGGRIEARGEGHADTIVRLIANETGRGVMYGTGNSYPDSHLHVIRGAFQHGDRHLYVYEGAGCRLGRHVATVRVL